VTTEVAGKAEAGPIRWVGATLDFLRAVKSELGKVTWPSRDELIKATRMIVVLSIVLGLAIGWMDLLLNLVLVDGVAALTR
jgi:preprotein translocase subunit SecE